MKTTVTLPEPLWLWVKARAAKDKVTLSKVIVKALKALRRTK